MKKTGKWILSLIARIAVIVLLFVIGRFVYFQYILPDLTGEIRIQSRILEQKLESSQRLEITTIDEEGVLDAKTNVIILGTVGSTTIRYRYTASIGIDLSKVIMTVDTDRIIFTLPETEILNDGIEALEISKQDFFPNESTKVWKHCLQNGEINAGNSISPKNSTLQNTGRTLKKLSMKQSANGWTVTGKGITDLKSVSGMIQQPSNTAVFLRVYKSY